jgi:quercetin dioxygenase-like cupin family protein
MRPASLVLGACTVWFCGLVAAPSTARPRAPQAPQPSPLILEKNEGEQRVWREDSPSHFILKVDPHNGGSSHLVLGTEVLAPGAKIERHKHPGSDEILLFQNGRLRVQLGESKREVHGGATVFIPADTWIAVDNVGSEPVALVFIFSAPGFEDFMRAESVREGEPMVPLSKAADEAIMKQYSHVVIYQNP